MRTGLKSLLVAGAVLIGGAGVVSAKAPASPSLDNTRWNVRVAVVHTPKFGTAKGFRDVLFFRGGTVSGQALKKEGLDLTPYSCERVKGSKTNLKWSFEQLNSTGEKLDWEGTANLRRHGSWTMKGTIIRTTADGQVYKFRLLGSGRPYTPEVPVFTPSGK